ncbi:hypothetical protein SAMN02910398_00011, partial [Butyrivibrio sp. YAB3001]
SHDVLKDFLERERKAVTMYSLYEYNQAGHMKVLKEEAYSDGVINEKHRVIESMLRKGRTPEEIEDLCGYSIDEVIDIKNSIKQD